MARITIYARSVHNQIPALKAASIWRFSLRQILDTETHTDGGRGPTVQHGPQIEIEIETPDACGQEGDRLVWSNRKLDWWEVFAKASNNVDGFSIISESH